MIKKILGKKFALVVFVLLGLLLVLISLVGNFSIFKSEAALVVPPLDALYRLSSASTEERIQDLLSRMSLQEKIGQMALVEKNSVQERADVATYGIGALLSGFGAKPESNTGEAWAEMVGGFIADSKTSRLGIPILYGVDAIHGHSNVPGATIFPHPIGLGASGDAKLVEAVAQATAVEIAATKINWTYSPTLDLPRDIRWGRTYETFSDDSKLVAKLGAAYVRGSQNAVGNTDLDKLFMISTPKHYVGIGGMVWGSSSNKNFKIDQGTTPSDELELRQEYLPPFKAAIDAGAMSVMVGLNTWGDTKLAANRYLVTTVLKDELQFTGFTVSDWYGVYEIPGGEYEASVSAINAGIDMVMLPFDYKSFVKNVERAVKRGDIPQERIDDAVSRILRAKFALGLFDDADKHISLDEIGSKGHRSLARLAVAQSLVLLKNDASVLPIKNSTKHIRVVGSAADNVGRQVGAWTVEWQGIDGNWLPGSTSILEGIKKRAGDSVKVEFEAGGNFVNSTEIAGLGIAIVGEKPYAEGWGDKEFPTLDSEDLKAIEKLQTVSKKVVVVVVSGRPLLITNEIDTWDGLVMAWLPGSEGSGVADVLFGDKTFTGSLPLPWPAYSQQLPIEAGGKTIDGTALLFPRYFKLR